MDALSDILRLVRLTGAVFLDATFTAPWSIGQPAGIDVCVEELPAAQHVAFYHLVTEGTCQVALAGEAPRPVEENQLIIIPGGDAHALGDDLSRPRGPERRFVVKRGPLEAARIEYGGGGIATRIVCGYLACESALFDALLAALPRVMIVDVRDDHGGQWITSSIRFSLGESATPKPGADAVLAKLSELVFAESIRRHIESLPPDQKGWLAGLRDPFVGKALGLMHAKPARGWTVDALARDVGLSRSALADRFAALIGHPPMQYLTRWRLQLAAEFLRTRRSTIAEIAAEVGYDSEAAFSRAFKRELGEAPATWRRSSAALNAVEPREMREQL